MSATKKKPVGEEDNHVPLERRISLLENRLIFMEKFMEMRFPEAFRDFTIRNDVEPDKAPENKKRKESSQLPRTSDRTLSDSTFPSGSRLQEEMSKIPENRRVTRARGRRDSPAVDSTPDANTSGRNLVVRKQLAVSLSRISQGDLENKVVTTEGTTEPTNKTLRIIKILRTESINAKANEQLDPLEDNHADTVDNYTSFPNPGGDETQYGEEKETELKDDDDWQGEDPLSSLESDNHNMSDSGSKPSSRKRSRKSNPEVGTSQKKRIRKKSSKSTSSKPMSLQVSELQLPEETVVPEGFTKCPECHIHCRSELFASHMENMHVKERPFPCSFCNKRFFKKINVQMHERLHQPDIYRSKCRVPGCEKMGINLSNLLNHERHCIRKALMQGRHVDQEVLEDVRNRSRNIVLGWPGEQEGGHRCTICRKWFDDLEQLNNHRKSNHAKWKCAFCEEKVFMTKYRLKRHLVQVHHKDNNEEVGIDGGVADVIDQVSMVHVKQSQSDAEDQGDEGGDLEISLHSCDSIHNT